MQSTHFLNLTTFQNHQEEKEHNFIKAKRLNCIFTELAPRPMSVTDQPRADPYSYLLSPHLLQMPQPLSRHKVHLFGPNILLWISSKCFSIVSFISNPSLQRLHTITTPPSISSISYSPSSSSNSTQVLLKFFSLVYLLH